MNCLKFILVSLLIFHSRALLADCSTEAIEGQISYLTSNEAEGLESSARSDWKVAESLKNLFSCNETKFDDIKIQVPSFTMEWVAVDCSEWVRRPGVKRRIFKRKSCATHYEYFPRITAAQQEYFLESFSLFIYFDGNEFIRATVAKNE